MKIASNLFFLIYLFTLDAYCQLSDLAEENFSSAKFERIETGLEEDAVIIFDRTYLKFLQENGNVIELETVHRKIKIHSLFGLEKFNKLYIPVYKDHNVQFELRSCRVKTIKPDNKIITSNFDDIVESTLPANVPFFYKKEGNVNMLAIKQLNIGDEIEYLYTIRRVYNREPSSFEKTNRELFSSEFRCLEKSMFFESKNFSTQIWPSNFHNGVSYKSDFSFQKGKKISLLNIPENSIEVYANDQLDQPFIYYYVANQIEKNKNSWDKVLQRFNSGINKINQHLIFDGQNISDFHDEIEFKSGDNLTSIFELLLKSINAPLEKDLMLYQNDIEGEIDIAFSYAMQISKLMKKLNIPLKFHFLTDKRKAPFDPKFASIYQFSTIVISFIDEKGEKKYMPLLEPFSNLNEVKLIYSDSECFTINQFANGEKNYEMEYFPKVTKNGVISRSFQVQFQSLKNDSLIFEVKDSLSFQGNEWLKRKVMINYLLKDTLNLTDHLKKFIENEFALVDSIFNIKIDKKTSCLNLSFNYLSKIRIPKESKIVKLKPEYFIENIFYTPYYQKNQRKSRGYLFNEPRYNYSLSLNTKGKLDLLESETVEKVLSNDYGQFTSAFENSNFYFNFFYDLKFDQNSFDNSGWVEVYDLRQHMYSVLNKNLFFKIQQ